MIGPWYSLDTAGAMVAALELTNPRRIAARVVAHSVSVPTRRRPRGVQLVTVEAMVPKWLLAEINTHRELSRNAASMRAIPTARIIEQVRSDPFVPPVFYSNKKGMQGGDPLVGRAAEEAREVWLAAAAHACASAEKLSGLLDVHKQHAGRILEPFAWVPWLATATWWRNFFRRRVSTLAQPEMDALARAISAAIGASIPTPVDVFGWHLPYVLDDERDQPIYDLLRVSTGRCARVSLATHDGRRAPSADVRLYGELLAHGHMSPFEHPAQVGREEGGGYVYVRHTKEGEPVMERASDLGNLGPPWVQHRKMVPMEACIPGEAEEPWWWDLSREGGP